MFKTEFSSGQNSFHFKKDHDTIRVKNLKVAANFYGGILQLKEIPNGGLPDHIRWFEFGNGIQLHLVESKETVQTYKGVHMALSTDRLDEFINFLKLKHIAFESGTGEPGTTNTRPDGIKQIFLQDPDGYWIEINNNVV